MSYCLCVVASLLQVKRFSLHSKAVKHISFDDKAEYFASCCGDNYISVGYTTVTATLAASAAASDNAFRSLSRASISSTLLCFLGSQLLTLRWCVE